MLGNRRLICYKHLLLSIEVMRCIGRYGSDQELAKENEKRRKNKEGIERGKRG